jgi:hypothetical protein
MIQSRKVVSESPDITKVRSFLISSFFYSCIASAPGASRHWFISLKAVPEAPEGTAPANAALQLQDALFLFIPAKLSR